MKRDLHVLEPGVAVVVIVEAAVMALGSPRVGAIRRMQAAGIDAFGGPVRLLELAAPASPAPDEVVISVHAAGVGNWDEFVRVGNWDVGRQPPLALGVEAAGVVAAVGDDVTSLAPGDQVLTHPLPLRHQGAWAQWLLAPAALVARKPAAVGWAAAGAFPVPALTADQALTQAAPSPGGEWVLVHGAGGVTGGLAVQLAVARGASVVATAGPSSAARVGGYGARVVLDYHDPKWPARVRDASPGGRGVGAAVNAAPGGAAAALQAVATDGRLATITGDPPRPERGVEVTDVYVRADGARLGGLVAALGEGRLSLHVGARLSLVEAGRALQDAVAGRVAGASVLMLR
jgi:NADPH:quinone reductase-like Zn-dependent oxidoreductase